MPFWGAWADRYSRKVIIVRSAVVEAVLFVLLAFVTDVRQLFLLVPLVGLVLGNTGVMLAEITDRAPRARLGFAISIVGVAGPLGLAVGPAFGGPIVDQYGLQALFLSTPPSRASSCSRWSFGLSRAPPTGSAACCR